MDGLLSIEEAAKKLGGISSWTVRAWLTKGRLKRTKVGGRTMIRESELERVIEDGGKSDKGGHASRNRTRPLAVKSPLTPRDGRKTVLGAGPGPLGPILSEQLSLPRILPTAGPASSPTLLQTERSK